jgi:hypothetical protein
MGGKLVDCRYGDYRHIDQDKDDCPDPPFLFILYCYVFVHGSSSFPVRCNLSKPFPVYKGKSGG